MTRFHKYVGIWLIAFLVTVTFSIILFGASIYDFYSMNDVARTMRVSDLYRDFGYKSLEEWKSEYLAFFYIKLGFGLVFLIFSIFFIKK